MLLPFFLLFFLGKSYNNSAGSSVVFPLIYVFFFNMIKLQIHRSCGREAAENNTMIYGRNAI